MDIFDDEIREIKLWLQQRRAEGNARIYDAVLLSGKGSSNSPARQSRGTIIFKEDTCLELGHPSVGSCAASLATHDFSLIEDGRISLLGPEIGELEKGTMVPFAQIALACTRGDVQGLSRLLDRQIHRSAQDENYMIRSIPSMIWARVSKQAVNSGFSFQRLGQRLIKSLRHECDEISALELLFVTTGREDISFLNKIIDAARVKMKKILSFELREDDVYECTTNNDCTECPEQAVCDSIREVIKLRKGDRIISFGGDD